MENVVRLEEYVETPGEQVFIIADSGGWIANSDNIPGVGCHILTDVYVLTTHGTDCIEPVNDFLDEYAGTGNTDLLEPMVFFGESCSITKLVEHPYSEYMLFVPKYTGNTLDAYCLYFVGGLDLLVTEIETCLNNSPYLEIDDLVLFRGEEVDLVPQITPYFDQREIEDLLEED